MRECIPMDISIKYLFDMFIQKPIFLKLKFLSITLIDVIH